MRAATSWPSTTGPRPRVLQRDLLQGHRRSRAGPTGWSSTRRWAPGIWRSTTRAGTGRRCKPASAQRHRAVRRASASSSTATATRRATCRSSTAPIEGQGVLTPPTPHRLSMSIRNGGGGNNIRRDVDVMPDVAVPVGNLGSAPAAANDASCWPRPPFVTGQRFRTPSTRVVVRRRQTPAARSRL